MAPESTAVDVPELVPARMLNEFTYCPRLFFLEWVQGRFADNEDTVEGRHAHRAVDRPQGRVPLPAEGDLIAARSVMLSSPGLGLVAKVDLIEGIGGRVRPVDTKRGSPPDTPERSWEPDRIQLCVQGLMLTEASWPTTSETPSDRGAVHSAMKAFGYPLQCSVFVCDLDGMEKIGMHGRIGAIIDHRVDSVAIVDPGETETRGVERFEFMGRSTPLPRGGAQIV